MSKPTAGNAPITKLHRDLEMEIITIYHDESQPLGERIAQLLANALRAEGERSRRETLEEVCAVLCNGCAQKHPLIEEVGEPLAHDWGFTKSECQAWKIQHMLPAVPPSQPEKGQK